MKKYEITDIIHPQNTQLHRIRALISVRDDVQPGDLGGFVQSEINLTQVNDGAWIYGNAICCDEARVQDRSYLAGNAIAKDRAMITDKAFALDYAVLKDKAMVRNGTVKGNAMIGGFGLIRRNQLTKLSPVAEGNAIILGIVAGAVHLTGEVFILPGQAIDSPLQDLIILDGKTAQLNNPFMHRNPPKKDLER